MLSRYVAAAMVAGLAALLGPRLTAPRDLPAGEPFSYEPPPSFILVTDEATRKMLGDVGPSARVWIHPPERASAYIPHVAITHASRQSALDESDVAKLAIGMPQVFAETGVQWTKLRAESRVRSDGARVALLEGACVKGELRYRTMQLAFPDDEGTSIVTAAYAADEAETWGPLFEETILKARGLARRARPTPTWMHAAWGAAGFVVALLALAFFSNKRKPAETK